MLTVNELFAGIGAFRKALIRMGLPHKVVGISEIDRFAIKSYEAIYGEVRNYGDISKVKKTRLCRSLDLRVSVPRHFTCRETGRGCTGGYAERPSLRSGAVVTQSERGR